jgi:uncharacterized DUF497 family protein
MRFAWDSQKAESNLASHGVSFESAKRAFADVKAIVIYDHAHSCARELRWWLLGRVDLKVMLVRYTHRPGGVVRIIGAGYWRQGKDIYEKYWKKE